MGRQPPLPTPYAWPAAFEIVLLLCGRVYCTGVTWWPALTTFPPPLLMDCPSCALSLFSIWLCAGWVIHTPPLPPLPPQQATHGSRWRWWRLLIIGPMCASPASTSLGFSSTRQTATPPAASTSVRVLGGARLLCAFSSLYRSAPSFFAWLLSATVFFYEGLLLWWVSSPPRATAAYSWWLSPRQGADRLSIPSSFSPSSPPCPSHIPAVVWVSTLAAAAVVLSPSPPPPQIATLGPPSTCSRTACARAPC